MTTNNNSLELSPVLELSYLNFTENNLPRVTQPVSIEIGMGNVRFPQYTRLSGRLRTALGVGRAEPLECLFPRPQSFPEEALRQHYPPRLPWVPMAGAPDDNHRACSLVGEGTVVIGATRPLEWLPGIRGGKCPRMKLLVLFCDTKC